MTVTRMMTRNLARPVVRTSRGGEETIQYDDAALALFHRMTAEPSYQRKGLINTLIAALKTAGVWTKLDVLYVPAAHDSQAARLNWKSGNYNLTEVSSPTFTADRGYAGNGTTSYNNTGWNPAANGSAYTLDSAHMGVWVNATGSDVAGTALTSFGAQDASASVLLQPWRAGTAGGARINDATSSAIGGGAIATRLGHSLLRRSASSARSFCRNGVQSGSTSTTASVSVPNAAAYLGCINNNGSAASFTTDRIAAAHAGGDLSDAEVLALYNALNAYLAAIGAA